MEARCQKSKSDAIVLLGDNIYPHGVSSVRDPIWQTNLLDFFHTPCLSKLKIYAVLGNHDYDGNAQAQIDFTNYNEQWTMPFRYYDVAFGDLLSMTAIDPRYPDYCFFSGSCMLNFMLDSLDEHQAKTWQITVGHYPLTSTSDNKDGKRTGSWIGRGVERMLCSKQNDIYFSWHAHHLEHTNSGVCDMDLVVSGAGGGGRKMGVDQRIQGEADFAVAELGFTELVATPKQLTVVYFNVDGKSLHSLARDRADSN